MGKEGEGFHELTGFFNWTRLRVCAQGIGIARAALEESIKYTKKRQQFGAPLSSFQATQFKLAEMATKIKAARNLYYEAAWLADHGTIDHGLIAMAKWYAGEIAVRCTDEALQMHGDMGTWMNTRCSGYIAMPKSWSCMRVRRRWKKPLWLGRFWLADFHAGLLENVLENCWPT